MSSQGDKRSVVEPAGLGSLDPALRERIGNALIAEMSPMWDKKDLLTTAASLACVGNDATTALAHQLFRHLSPRLGKDPGVTEKSTASQLKAALKRWDLSQTGKKDVLWQRICQQTQDSVRDAQGRPPRHCLVSAETRSELRGWRNLRLSQTAAKDMFDLSKSDLEGLRFIWEGRGGFAGKMYLLREVKQKAVERWGTWSNLRATQVRIANNIRAYLENTKQRQQQEEQEQEPAAGD